MGEALKNLIGLQMSGFEDPSDAHPDRGAKQRFALARDGVATARTIWRSRQAFRDPILLCVERGIRFGCLLVGNILAARSLGPDSFGAIQVLLATLSMLVPIADLGLDAIAPREVGRWDHPGLRNAASIIAVRGLIGSTVGLLFLWGAAHKSASADIVTWQIALFALAFPARCLETTEPLAQLGGWLGKYVGVRAAAAAAGLIAKILLIHADMPAGYFIAVIGSEYTLGLVGSFFIASRFSQPPPAERVPRTQTPLRDLLRQGFPLALSGIASSAYSRVDQVLVAVLLGVSSAGVYGAAVQVVSIWTILPMVMFAAAQPWVARLPVGSAGYVLALVRLYRASFLIGLGCAGMTCLSAFLLPHIFGDQYRGATVPLIVLSPTLVFLFIGVARTVQIVAEGDTIQHFYAALISAAVSLILNICFIPMWGLVGAACSATISAGIAAVGSCFVLPGLRGCKTMMLLAFRPRRFPI